MSNSSKNIKVEIDNKSGFCYGVIRAIETAERELQAGDGLFSLGEIVHNNVEVERLENKGLATISHEDMEQISGKKMLIRAHGEPPATYIAAARASIEMVDCTCPVVLKLQERIKKAYVEAKAAGGQLVIFGKRGHAEVNGLVGQTDGQAIVVEEAQEALSLDFTRPIYLFSQTTKSIEGFEELSKLILSKIIEAGGNSDQLKAHNTTCRQVTGRKPHLEKFAGKYDVIIFVSGKQSSNGKILFQCCKDVNPNTYFVEKPADIRAEWFEGYKSAGICGATSTPKWLMEEVAKAIVN
jgi:4-hydroxy-3-methylbut-2-enyl diphosphate reductase